MVHNHDLIPGRIFSHPKLKETIFLIGMVKFGILFYACQILDDREETQFDRHW
jgi:hypothetical protein